MNAWWREGSWTLTSKQIVIYRGSICIYIRIYIVYECIWCIISISVMIPMMLMMMMMMMMMDYGWWTSWPKHFIGPFWMLPYIAMCESFFYWWILKMALEICFQVDEIYNFTQESISSLVTQMFNWRPRKKHFHHLFFCCIFLSKPFVNMFWNMISSHLWILVQGSPEHHTFYLPEPRDSLHSGPVDACHLGWDQSLLKNNQWGKKHKYKMGCPPSQDSSHHQVFLIYF